MNEKIKTDIGIDQFEVFPWNKNFETGHAEIDAQHKKLVELLNQLAKTLIGNEKPIVNAAFDALAAYANAHFDKEEEIWLEYFNDDSWLHSHQMNHASFLPRVIELKDQEGTKSLTDVVEHIINFLIRWLAFHIIDNDKRMALVVQAVKKGLPLDEAKLHADKKMSGSMRLLIETILNMYDGLSNRAIELMRERRARIKAEERLREANKKLEQLSRTDQLTGLYNRRYFSTVFLDELKRARRHGITLTYMMIDIDYFKTYNDNYGHLAGDEALKQVGKCLTGLCRRSSDQAFRIGGEEFGLLSSGLDEGQAEAFAHIVRSEVEALKIEHNGSDVMPCITVSIGVATKVPGPEDTLNDYFKLADNRLYIAKNQGRNRVISQD